MKPHEYKFVVPHELEELTNAISTLAVIDEERVPVWESMGRVLSRDVVVPIDVPPRPKAAYDGYAVRSQDVSKAPIRLRLVGSISIGEVPSIKVGTMETAYVTTGATCQMALMLLSLRSSSMSLAITKSLLISQSSPGRMLTRQATLQGRVRWFLGGHGYNALGHTSTS